MILVLYLSAFVCKLSIMEKKRNLHAFVLGFVMKWLCLMFDTVFCIQEKKYTTVDALRLCYKSFFWTAFCIFEHNCIAWLAAVIDSPEVWLDVNSDLLCCFVSFLILRLLIASFWFIECMTVNALSPIIISFYAKLESQCLFFSFSFFHNLLKIWNWGFCSPKLKPSEVTHVTHVNGSFNRCKWQKRKIVFIVSNIELPQQIHLESWVIITSKTYKIRMT